MTVYAPRTDNLVLSLEFTIGKIVGDIYKYTIVVYKNYNIFNGVKSR